MPKIPECNRCQYFSQSLYLVCGINPSGPAGETCDDFEATVQAAAAPKRHPLGGGYYLGDWIPQPFPTLTAAEQLSLLDWHPQFTGRCPNCEMPIAAAAEGQWKCRYCEWKDAAEIAAK